jgi:SAM-dependent methyltransferase
MDIDKPASHSSRAMTASVGFYERKQLLSPSRIVRWSHGRRFDVAVRFAQRLGGRALLDYGCGDGTFLAKVSPFVDRCVGTDLAPCDLSHLKSARFVPLAALDASHEHAYDLVFCMEVLEHCTVSDEQKVLSDLRRSVSPGGAVVISVPIEIGPTLLGKNAMRQWLGKNKVGDYSWSEKYPLGTLLKMVFADERTAIERPVYRQGDGPPYHSHFGFNWRALGARLRERFAVEEQGFSPMSWTRGLVSSQAWFVCRPR